MSGEKKIVAIGDSITYGFPYLPCMSWVHIVGEELGFSIINKGVNGNTSSQMVERFEYILGLYREDMREYVRTNKLAVIDFYTAFLKSKRLQVEFYADVLHPNERGYRFMAEIAVKVLQTQMS